MEHFYRERVLSSQEILQGLKHIKRSPGKSGGLITQQEIETLMNHTDIVRFLAYTAPKRDCPVKVSYGVPEYVHGSPHIFVGGCMTDPHTSTNDPIFFLHHSFVDLIWEMWRQEVQDEKERETSYPPDDLRCSGQQHFAGAPMRPFGSLTNIDGLSDLYTKELYEYAPRPNCSNNCGDSPYLVCDEKRDRCVAKIKKFGACPGYTFKDDVCHLGSCNKETCYPDVDPFGVGGAPAPPPPTGPVPPPLSAPTESCFNENPCCSTWAKEGECSKNKNYMNIWCQASCRLCKPKSYALEDDCKDRHSNCAEWSTEGECKKNALWMAENCRKSCRLCDRTRASACLKKTGEKSCKTTTDGCFNENECCPVWALLGQCSRNPAYMACNCRVSCGHCLPKYDYGACGQDYYPECKAKAKTGECKSNSWTRENCRASCGHCPKIEELKKKCGSI